MEHIGDQFTKELQLPPIPKSCKNKCSGIVATLGKVVVRRGESITIKPKGDMGGGNTCLTKMAMKRKKSKYVVQAPSELDRPFYCERLRHMVNVPDVMRRARGMPEPLVPGSSRSLRKENMADVFDLKSGKGSGNTHNEHLAKKVWVMPLEQTHYSSDGDTVIESDGSSREPIDEAVVDLYNAAVTADHLVTEEGNALVLSNKEKPSSATSPSLNRCAKDSAVEADFLEEVNPDTDSISVSGSEFSMPSSDSSPQASNVISHGSTLRINLESTSEIESDDNCDDVFLNEHFDAGETEMPDTQPKPIPRLKNFPTQWWLLNPIVDDELDYDEDDL